MFTRWISLYPHLYVRFFSIGSIYWWERKNRQACIHVVIVDVDIWQTWKKAEKIRTIPNLQANSNDLEYSISADIVYHLSIPRYTKWQHSTATSKNQNHISSEFYLWTRIQEPTQNFFVKRIIYFRFDICFHSIGNSRVFIRTIRYVSMIALCCRLVSHLRNFITPIWFMCLYA